MIEEFSVLPWHKGKWFCPIWANQWQQVFPDTIFKPLRPTLTLLVCSTKPWLEGGERERLFVFVTWIKSLYVYGMLEGLLFMHYPSMRAIDGRLNSQGQWSNCHMGCWVVECGLFLLSLSLYNTLIMSSAALTLFHWYISAEITE